MIIISFSFDTKLIRSQNIYLFPTGWATRWGTHGSIEILNSKIVSVINTYQNAVYDKVTIDAENTRKVVFILTILWNEVKADIIVFPEF